MNARPVDVNVLEFEEAAAPLKEALRSAGVDPTDFGRFVSDRAAAVLGPVSFDFSKAVPVMLEWLPRIDHRGVKESIVRSLTSQPGARAAGPKLLIREFRRPSNSGDEGLLWAIANALATLAGPQDADDLIELAQDQRYGIARQMLCDALSRTRDPRAVDVLMALMADDEVAGHAVSALRRRRLGPDQQIRWRSELNALIERPSASAFAIQGARAALKKLDQAGT